MNIKQGDILSIPLLHNLGYTYAKVILPHEFLKCEEQIMLKVFNYRTTEVKKDVNFKEVELITNPLLLAGKPRLRGSSKSKVLNNVELLSDDYHIPDFKNNFKLLSNFDKVKDEKELQSSWTLVRNLYPNHQTEIDYEKIKHLEFWGNLGYDLFLIRITMEFLKLNGEKIGNYFPEIKKQSNDMYDKWIKFMYFLVLNSVEYSKIPKDIRGVARK
ncbi:hypothetical protein [Flexithrix dorotheae]|uniref:hypothetical protein n=1 Tax=Flexithrix dorotheae TaxID=70993 RepID=UPI000378307D|nr:hypothetical protein [Flexithrix dorotheae]